MRFTFALHAGLSLLNGLLVLFQDILTVLEQLSSGLRINIGAIEPEVCQVRIREDEVGMVSCCIQDDVEEGDGPTGISGVLLHEEDVGRSIFSFEVMALGLLVLLLNRSLLVEEEDAKCWLRDHFQCPFLSGEHFSERIVLSLEPHLLDELVDDLWIRL